ncbi:MAG TPA: hypothetical protein VF932_02510, partial [Anaerolineae bacterium]
MGNEPITHSPNHPLTQSPTHRPLSTVHCPLFTALHPPTRPSSRRIVKSAYSPISMRRSRTHS